MLKEIYIRNLAVIKEAVIPLEKKLNIFTGETGAGKSILINGINAVLGQRCSKDIVRTGCDKAVITALFTDLSDDICEKLDELGISHDNEEITVTREISADGGSVARINSRTASASLLKEIGSMLINIHGQHDNQILLDSEKHLQILDDFGGDDTLLEQYRVSFRELQQTARRLGELKKREKESAFRQRELNEIIDDIGEIELSAGEDEQLEKEYSAAKNAENIIIAVKNAVSAIIGEDAANDMLVTAETEIAGYTDDNDKLSELYERLSAAEIELSDIASELEATADRIELDGQRLGYLADRLSVINKLKRKYATDCDGLIKLYDDACRDIMQLEGSGDEIIALTQKREQLLHTVTEQAKALYEYREKIGERFAKQVTAELEFLNMSGVVIAVRHEKGKLTVNGMDSVEFLISANKGEDPKPISKIASGGELSRIMLAVKTVLAGRENTGTLIFDEIATGISGVTAWQVAGKIGQLAENHQIICITHLPQIAAKADTHFMIEKHEKDGRTVTEINEVSGDAHVDEIARLLGSENITDAVRANAVDLLKQAGKYGA